MAGFRGGLGRMVIEIVDAERVGMSSERVGWARDLVANHVAAGRSPSAVAVVLRRGQPVLAEAFGVRGPHGEPLDLDDVWPIASAGKPITAAAAMSLVEEGRIGINEPVVTYIPELIGPHEDEVLVHHLLTHTAGWESAQRTHRLETFPRSGKMTDPPPGRDFLTHLLLSLALDPIRVARPGEEMQYDNAPYELLAEIVRRVTDGTLDAAMRSRLFDPLGMTRSAGIVDDDLRPHLVTRAEGLPFGPGWSIVLEGELWESSDSGAAAVHTSAPDLACFGQMILNGGELGGARVLAPSTVAAMTTNRIPGVPATWAAGKVISEASWGYGFTVVQEERFPFFAGGLVPMGSVLHPGAGGIAYWVDFEHEIVGVFFEVITEIDEFMSPVSGIVHRFQDVVTGAVLE